MRHCTAALLAVCFATLLPGQCAARGFDEERPTVPFEVSKLGPLPPYSRAKFNELWKAFREQYGVRDGIFVKWNWADSWLRHGGSKPEPSKATFEVISGLDAAGKPLSDKILTRRILFYESATGKLDQDVRGKRNGSSSSSGMKTSLVLADPSQPKPGKFTCACEGDESIDEEAMAAGKIVDVMYEVGTLADTPVNQARFTEALKAGSEFRVVLPKDVACAPCEGIGRPRGSRSLSEKCRECGGSGKQKTIEVYLLKW